VSTTHVQRRVRNGSVAHVARYFDADGKRHSKSFRSQANAERFLVQVEAARLNGAFQDPAAGLLTFDQWADRWWEVWAAEPDRSPTTLASAESRLRLHLRPRFGRHRLGEVRPSLVRQWQQELHGRLSHASVLACRSLLNRILQAAEDEGLLPANPVRKVPPPKRPVDPEVIFGRARPRVLTPKQLGQLLAHAGSEDRDRLLVLAATGLRAGELCGLRPERVRLRERRLEVVTVRYDAGRVGRGYKPRPKSTVGIRVVPLAEAVAEVLARYVPGGRGSLLFPEATRYVLRHGYLRAVRQASRHGYLVGLDLRGPHDLRHTFATWLEDDGIPTRVIDELMGHAATRRPSWASERGSAMGAVYRHTTAEMEARVVRALDARLTVVRSVIDAIR
jgi:integrase